MSLAIYNGTTLLSISYCNRKLVDLEKQYNSTSIRGHDISPEDPELKKLSESILYYSDIIAELKNNFASMEDNELINFVIDQIVLKIKESKLTKASISFSCVSEYTVEITIANVFSTELTFKKKVYEISSEPNDDYDGYLDTAKSISVSTKTSYLNEIISTIKKAINDKVPKISIN